MTKARKNDVTTGYLPEERTREVVYIEQGHEDDPNPFRATVRSHLTVEEFDRLVWTKDTPPEEIHRKLAPFVLDWNLLRRNAETGQVERVPAPAEGDPTVFRLMNDRLFFHLLVSIKMRSVNPVDPKSLMPSGATDAPTNGSEPASV